MNILFICLGNICRSVTAEEIFRTFVKKQGLQDAYHIDSAGLIDYHAGKLADSRMRQHAAKHGYRLTHRSRPITSEDFNTFDLIITMDEKNVKTLTQLAPQQHIHKIVRMADYLQEHRATYIPDPYYGTSEDFELVIELLEDACFHLLESLKDE